MHLRRVPRLYRYVGLLALSSFTGCNSTTDTVGFDNAATVMAPPSSMPSSMPTTMPTSMPTTMPTTMPTSMPPDEMPTLTPLTGPQEYPNPFGDLLGKSTQEIDDKIDAAFEQLFYGASDEVIYFAEGDDAASIKDILHNQVRTEGIGLAMMITVELGKQEEFDKLWTYAKRENRVAPPAPAEGYFSSFCDVPNGMPQPCIDPYGAEQFAMALIFAHDRWGDDGAIDYGTDALDILNVMKNKEKMNGGIVEDVVNMFDSETHLAFDQPDRRRAQQTRPSILMPAYYALWAEATGDQYWDQAAEAARAYFPTVANTKTGLVPVRSYFDGTPMAGSDTFSAESYRLYINLVLDEIWLRGNPAGVSQCNTVLGFFSDVGIDKYVGNYELDGTPTSTGREYALMMTNGITAAVSKNADRKAYIDAVWNHELPTGSNRYYTGILQLFALLVLSGKMQVL